MAKATTQGADIGAMTIKEAIAHLNKIYGDNTIICAADADGTDISFTSTGSYALDVALGGGWPENRVIEIRGAFSSFKSTISLTSIVNFQRKYEDGYAVYVDVEKSFDRRYARRLGVDLTRLLIVNPDSGEQAVDVIKDIMKMGVPIFMVVDSIAALVPTAEVEGNMEQQFMGLQARLVARMMRIVTARLKRNLYTAKTPPVTILALNQLRQKIGVMFGSPETTPGGIAREFFYSTIVRFHASISKENVIAKEEEVNRIKRNVRYGQKVDFKVIKNKCGGPQHEEGDFTFYERDYNGHAAYSFDNEEALFHYGAFNDVINWTPETGYTFGKLAFKKEHAFVAALRKLPKTCGKIYQSILLKVRPEDDDTDIKIKQI